MIKLVALDVDGTLVNKDIQIPPRTLAAIREARARGVRFAIVTGRMYQSTVPMARTLGLEGTPVVAYNGALLMEFPSGRPIFHQPIPLPMAKRIVQFCEERGYHLHAYVNDELYMAELNRWSEFYVRIARVEPHPVGALSVWLKEPPTKLLIVDRPDRIPAIKAEIGDVLGSEVTAVASKPEFLEMIASSVSKGTALQALAAAMGLDRSEVMAVGDGMNDLPMLSWAGTSFAINHAPAALKKAATYVTDSGPGDGVAEALTRMGLTGE